MADFEHKLWRDPLNLEKFMLVIDNIRYINLQIFNSNEAAKLELPTHLSNPGHHLLQHITSIVRLLSGPSALTGVFVKLSGKTSQPNLKSRDAIRFDWFTLVLIAAPPSKLMGNQARWDFVKHWCGPNVPNVSATSRFAFPYNVQVSYFIYCTPFFLCSLPGIFIACNLHCPEFSVPGIFSTRNFQYQEFSVPGIFSTTNFQYHEFSVPRIFSTTNF